MKSISLVLDFKNTPVSIYTKTAMGALEMGLTEEELQPLVDSWCASNPMITAFWWDIDWAVKTTIKQHIQTEVRSNIFIAI